MTNLIKELNKELIKLNKELIIYLWVGWLQIYKNRS